MEIQEIHNLEGAALGNSLSGLMQNMPQLHSLHCYGNHLGVDGVGAFQPALRENRTLKLLHPGGCSLGDEGVRLIADALVGSTTMDHLNVFSNNITFAVLYDITCMIESTQIKTIAAFNNSRVIFNNQDATQHFVSTLQQKKSSVQEMPDMGYYHFPGDKDSEIATCASIKNSLVRNRQLNRVNLLLTPPPPPPPPQQQPRISGTKMLKISHKAITKFANAVDNNNNNNSNNNAIGASPIFDLLTARPQLLEKRLKRPSPAVFALAAATTTPVAAAVMQHDGSTNSSSTTPIPHLSLSSSSSTADSQPSTTKRQRLL